MQGPISRRTLLKGALAAGGAAVASRSWVPRSARAGEPRIIVVGAGLAGMTAAYRIFSTTGLRPLVFESHSEIGGRTRTIRGLDGDQITERGGTFISSGDHAIRALAKELDLSPIDSNQTYPRGRATYFFKGRRRSATALFDDEEATARNAYRHFDQIKWPATYDHSNDATQRWDEMTVAEWIDGYTPGGLDSLYGSYLQSFFHSDYGGSVTDASSLHLIADFGAPGRSYDERFQVRGGSERIVRALHRRLPEGTVSAEMPLRRVARLSDDSYRCSFGIEEPYLDIAADRVILALPFTALRDVERTAAGLSALKETAIQRLGMGLNSKMSVQFKRSTWGPQFNGEAETDLLPGEIWPGHVGQSGRQAILVSSNGAPFSTSYGDAPAHARAAPEVAAEHVEALDRVWPGAAGAFIDDEAYLDYWPADPWVKGSYAYYPTGGFTSYAGAEGLQEGGIHFAGEHTCRYGNRGTMNGAVSSGNRAAQEVITQTTPH